MEIDQATRAGRSIISPVEEAVRPTRSALTLKSTRWVLPLVLVPHLAMAIYLGNRFLVHPDQDAYLNAAENILAGRGLSLSFDTLAGFVKKGEPTSFYGLGTPLFLAAQIAIVGKNYFLLRLGNIVLFALSLIMFRGICRFWLSERLSNLAMFVMGLSPFYVAYNQLFLSDMLFLCCELGVFFFLFRYFKHHLTRDLVLSAAFVALSLFVRTNLLPFLLVTAILIAFYRKWTHVLVYLGVALLIVSPYCIRNSLNNHAFFPFDGKAAINLWMYNSDAQDGSFWDEDFAKAPAMPPLDGLTEKQRADLLMGLGVAWIEQHPTQFLRLAVIKAVRFISPFPKEPINFKYAAVLTPYAFAIIMGFFVGLPTIWSRDPKSILVLLLFLYTLAIDMVFMPATRHRVLYDPFFILVGVNYVASLGPLRIRRRLRENVPGPADLVDASSSRS